ncbi:methionyl-tRNA formyltransferase, partial [bacterium]|nr:methionyl-tRNA formyltransferase [bacterium]
MSYVIAYNKSWCRELPNSLFKKLDKKFIGIDNVDQLNIVNLNKIKPHYIFFPHWSNIIKEDIYKNYNCIIFHMTDLPYGRGGSPLQNLIIRGHKDTMITAIRCMKGLDAGPIYIKKPLSLEGSA